MNDDKPIGSIGWHDLTVSAATPIAEFYRQVVGWELEAVDVDDYQDFMVKDSSGEAVAGICHARGDNANLPAQWLFYLRVADLEKSIASCESLGGTILCSPRDLGGYGTFCVIQDPAGAVAALIQPPTE